MPSRFLAPSDSVTRRSRQHRVDADHPRSRKRRAPCKVTGSQATTSGSTKTNDKGTPATSNTTGMSSSSTAGGAFARLDTNHDGKLSAAEAAADPKVQGMWKKLDTNNDGVVSQAEFAAHQADLK